MSFWNKLGSVASGLLTHASPLATSIFTANQQRRTDQAQRDWASSEAEKAYQRNLEQWNRENAYNDPSAKMARLKAAGLNPNLAYGNPQTAGVSAASPQKQAPKGQFNNPYANMNPLAIANASVMQQQARSIQLENMKKEYDLGIRSPKYKHVQLKWYNAEKKMWEVEFHKEPKRDNLYLKRIKAKTQNLQHDTTVKQFEAKLANEGWVKGDPAFLRFIAVALKEQGLSLQEITSDLVKKVVEKLMD